MGWVTRLIKGFTREASRQQAASNPRSVERLAELEQLRVILEAAFSPETASPDTATAGRPPSAGQCAAVSAIVWDRFDGELVSAAVQGQSHWFNRLNIGGHVMDVDLTGDQFGLQAVRYGEPGSLCPATRTRTPHELREETVRRAIRLAEKAGLQDSQRRLLRLLNAAAGESRGSDLSKRAPGH